MLIKKPLTKLRPSLEWQSGNTFTDCKLTPISDALFSDGLTKEKEKLLLGINQLD